MENCKLKIENWNNSRVAGLALDRRRLFNLQFAIYNLQFTVLSSLESHRIRSLATHFASRAISASDRPLERWISVRAILPLVMSSASTSTRPLLPTPQRTCTGAPFGSRGGSPSIQHSP